MFAQPLQGERVRTCSMREVDFNTYLGWLNDPEVTKYLTTVRDGMSEKKARDYIRCMDVSNSDVLFAIVDRIENKFIGTAHFSVNWAERKGSFGIMIGEKSMWGKGLGTEIFELLTYYGFMILFLQKITDMGAPLEHKAVHKYMRQGGYKCIKKDKQTAEYEMTLNRYLKRNPGYINAIPFRQGRMLGLWKAKRKGKYY